MNRFSVRALLEGRKTQTRRVVKNLPEGEYPIRADGRFWLARDGMSTGYRLNCRHGQTGGRLWVRESWELLSRNVRDEDGWYAIRYVADGCESTIPCDRELAVLGETGNKPSIFMPYEFSRFRLEIADVRVERVQDISDDDVTAEGLPYRQSTDDFAIGKYPADGRWYWGFPTPAYNGDIDYVYTRDAQRAFQELWDSINADRGYTWEDNPWVWVVEFRDVSDDVLRY
jgi:hypothetical protein